MDYILLGRRIKEERIRLQMTQEKLAESVNLSTAYIGQIERGERHVALENIVLIADCLGVTIDYILSESNQCNYENVWAKIMVGRTEIEKDMAIDTVRTILKYADKSRENGINNSGDTE